MSKDPFNDALDEDTIVRLVSIANHAIASGREPPLVLGALESHLVRGLRALLAERDGVTHGSKKR